MADKKRTNQKKTLIDATHGYSRSAKPPHSTGMRRRLGRLTDGIFIHYYLILNELPIVPEDPGKTVRYR